MYPLQEDIEFLEHFGVKGMQWGVRRDRRAAALVKVGQGKGTKEQKVRALARYTPLDALKLRGLKKASLARGQRQLSRNARVRNGESSTFDKLAFFGGTKFQDIIPTTGSNNKNRDATKAAIGASIAGVVLVGAGKTAFSVISRTAKEANQLRKYA